MGKREKVSMMTNPAQIVMTTPNLNWKTDLDVDICSESNDESSGLDISDTTLHKQIIDWRTKQRKLRSERRIKLRIVRQSETADKRKVRIAWRVRRRTK